MASSPNQKMKLLYLMKIFLEKSDEQSPLTVKDIIVALAAYDIKAERKSVYSDIKLLCKFGIEIEEKRSKSVGYYVTQRQFELAELKLLVDAVQSARFITKRKSEVLIKKLSSLTSNEQAKHLKRHVYLAGRAKTMNETVLYSIDNIHSAINENKKITFKYFDYSVNKERVFRKEGNLYAATPVTLCWNNDNYYLITYSGYFGNYTHYRVDRMSDVSATDENGDAHDVSKFNIAEYAKRVFGMFEGEVVRARLSFENSLVNAVLDHFGNDVWTIPSDDGWFDILVDVSASPVFFSWMFMFGGWAVIKEPDSLVSEMRELIKDNRRQYPKK